MIRLSYYCFVVCLIDRVNVMIFSNVSYLAAFSFITNHISIVRWFDSKVALNLCAFRGRRRPYTIEWLASACLIIDENGCVCGCRTACLSRPLDLCVNQDLRDISRLSFLHCGIVHTALVKFNTMPWIVYFLIWSQGPSIIAGSVISWHNCSLFAAPNNSPRAFNDYDKTYG
jgi:hypothetical protein